MKIIEIGTGMSDYTKPDADSMQATSNINPREEIFASYRKTLSSKRFTNGKDEAVIVKFVFQMNV